MWSIVGTAQRLADFALDNPRTVLVRLHGDSVVTRRAFRGSRTVLPSLDEIERLTPILGHYEGD